MVSSKLVDWQKVTFEDAFTDITSKATKVDQSEFLHSGKFPIVDQGQNFIAGYTDDEEIVWGDDLPVVIFGDHTRILKYVDFPFVLGADGTKVLKPNKDIHPLFAYYQLLSFDIPSAGYSRHFKFLKDFTFQYPSLTEQKRIASLLGGLTVSAPCGGQRTISASPCSSPCFWRCLGIRNSMRRNGIW